MQPALCLYIHLEHGATIFVQMRQIQSCMHTSVEDDPSEQHQPNFQNMDKRRIDCASVGFAATIQDLIQSCGVEQSVIQVQDKEQLLALEHP